MSPVTRARADSAGLVGDLQAEYYSQRSSAGLLITEATAILPEGRGGAFLPGLWDDAQIAGWKQVTDAVHAKGAKIFSQLWHAGRLSHSSLNPSGGAPVAPSPYHQQGQVFTESGMADFEPARVLDISELPGIVDAFRQGAIRAQKAGFDGAEIHGAHSYLLDAFVRDMTNQRTDSYGGSIENRARLLLEVTKAVTEVFGPERTAIRLAPVGKAYGAWDSNPEPLFTYIVEQLNALGVAWLDLVEGDTGITREVEGAFDLQKLRKLFKGSVIANNLYTREMAIEAIESGRADLIAFGRDFIGNPDLVERLAQNLPLTDASPLTYYGGGAKGYTDFPRASA